jgi:hypothetical protein
MADQYPITDTPFGHRITHVWAAIVNGVKFVAGFENCQMCAVDMKGFAFQFLKIVSGAELVINKLGFVYFYWWQRFNVDGTDTGFLMSRSWSLHNKPPIKDFIWGMI